MRAPRTVRLRFLPRSVRLEDPPVGLGERLDWEVVRARESGPRRGRRRVERCILAWRKRKVG